MLLDSNVFEQDLSRLEVITRQHFPVNEILVSNVAKGLFSNVRPMVFSSCIEMTIHLSVYTRLAF